VRLISPGIGSARGITSTMFRKYFIIYGIPFLLGFLVRLVLFINWVNSPFRYYHKIYGMDMIKLLRFGENFYHTQSKPFTLYRLLIASILTLNNGIHNPKVIIIIQLLAGLLTCLMISFITYHLLRNPYAASLAGIIAALYSPTLMYECFVLKETIFLFFSVLSLATIIQARNRHFTWPWLLLCGFTISLPVLVRFSGLVWSVTSIIWITGYPWKFNLTIPKDEFVKLLKKWFFRLILILLGTAIGLVPVSIFNKCCGHRFYPFTAEVSYAYNLGEIPNPTSLNISSDDNLKREIIYKSPLKSLKNYGSKFILIFKAFEITNNLNFYFVEKLLFPLKFLPGALFLIPLAATGIILSLLKKGLIRKEGILFLYFFAYVVPLCIFVPLSRYRLIFLPVFAYMFAFLISYLIKKFPRKEIIKILLILVLYFTLLIWAKPKTIPMRSTDFLSYGKALQNNNANQAEIEHYFKMAFLMEPNSKAASSFFFNFLFSKGKFADAARILAPIHKKNSNNYHISIKYAIALLGSNDLNQAEKVLKEITIPENNRQKAFYYYQFGELYLMQKNYEKALQSFKLALRYNKDKNLGNAIKQRINLIENFANKKDNRI